MQALGCAQATVPKHHKRCALSLPCSASPAVLLCVACCCDTNCSAGLLFQRRDPGPERTAVAQALWEAITNPSQGGSFFQDVPGCSATGWIPQYIDGAAGDALGRVYTFNTQFNDWGQRTNSGASLVAGGRAWRSNGRVELWTNARVEALHFEGRDAGSK